MSSRPLNCLNEAPSSYAVREMRGHIDRLEEENRQYRKAFEAVEPFPDAWQLTTQESRCLGCLARAYGKLVSIDDLGVLIFGADKSGDEYAVWQFISKLGRKLKAAGIEITGKRGQGYHLTPDSLAVIRAVFPAELDAIHAAAEAALTARIETLEAENRELRVIVAEPPSTPASLEPPRHRLRRAWRDYVKPKTYRGPKTKGGRHAR